MKKAPVAIPGDRRLKIQIGVCKRMLKEVASYEKEVITNEAKVQKMRDEGKDVYGDKTIAHYYNLLQPLDMTLSNE